MKLKILIILRFIVNFFMVKRHIFETKKRKFCIIENYLNNSFASLLPKNKTVFISIYNINIFVLFKVLLKQKTFFLKNFQRDYYLEAIKFFECTLIFSMIDNSKIILQLKNFLPQKKVIVIQNGTRLAKDNITKRNEGKYKTDYYFTFNKYYSSFLSKKVKSVFLDIGFIENNKFKIKKNYNKRKILYISEFDKGIYENKNNNPRFKNYFNPEKKILPVLENFCFKNNFNLYLYPRTSLNIEKNFYYKIFKYKKFIYLNRNLVNSYDEIDDSMLVVFMHSTLGYEALARGKKAAVFCGRTFLDKSRSFGWPKYSFKNKSFFWTNKINKKEILKILEAISLMKKKVWQKKSKKYLSDLCIYDYKNTKLKEFLSKKLII